MKDAVKTEKCVLFNVKNIQRNSTYVSCDLIHPSTEGHIMMGVNLAGLIKLYLGK